MSQKPDLIVGREDIEAAARRLAGVAVRTPLMQYPDSQTSRASGASKAGRAKQSRLVVKPESLQPTGSFKIRGAYTAITALTPEQRRRGVIAHSSGNHAQAVAYAAAAVGCPAVVVVPENAAEIKVESARSYGAQVVTVAASIEARARATSELADRHGYAIIPPFDDPRIIAGQGTIGLEIAADLGAASPGPGAGPEVGQGAGPVVLVPVSGGGLISGVATAVKATIPGAAVVGVEPELAADARASLRAGRRIAWPAAQTARTVADALRVEQLGELTFEHIRAYVDDIVAVTEEEIKAAVVNIADKLRLIAEPGGAAAVAAYLYRPAELPKRGTYVAVVSGGNISPALRAELLCGSSAASHAWRAQPALAPDPSGPA